MELTRERAVELLNITDANILLNFLYEYCMFHKKDSNLTNVFLQMITGMGMLKSLVNSTVLQVAEENNISLNIISDLRTNTIIKYF